jgi:hypothetical protein
MSRLWWIPVCLVVLIPPVVVFAGSDAGFDGVVSSIESRYHAHATRIPFLCIASLVARKATRGGVSGVHIAEFDDFSAQVELDELNRIAQEKLGPGWERMIRESGKKGKEQTLIFAHPDGDRMELFILDLDGSELDLVQVSVDPDHLNESIARYEHHDGDVSD